MVLTQKVSLWGAKGSSPLTGPISYDGAVCINIWQKQNKRTDCLLYGSFFNLITVWELFPWDHVKFMLNDNISKYHKFCFLAPKNGIAEEYDSLSLSLLDIFCHNVDTTFCVHMSYKYLLTSEKISLISIIYSQYIFVNTLFYPFPEVLGCIFILWWPSRSFDLLPIQPILCLKGFSLQPVSFSHLNILPEPLQLFLSYLLVPVLVSNQV